MNILEIEIQTDNLKETEIFYSTILGLKLIRKEENLISFTAGESTLTFTKSNELEPKYHFAFNIPHNKLEEALNWSSLRLTLLKNSDHEIVANFKAWNAKAFYFYDNNNNILEFIARFDLDNASNKDFDISSIQSISEIGIVSDKPMELADKLSKENNLSTFVKATESDKFNVLGNDNGLFIIVETNRKWYPTEQKAKKHYSKIKITTDGLIREIVVNWDDVSDLGN